MNHEIEQLCLFLSRLQKGEIGGQDACDEIHNLAALKMPELKDLFADLHHYIADEEIRDKDPGYRELQDSEMTKLITRLRTGDIAKANQVSFLKRT